jgi:hypothetical protein
VNRAHGTLSIGATTAALALATIFHSDEGRASM